MSDETIKAMRAKVFTVANYHFNGLGHISVDYKKVLEKGFKGIIDEVEDAMSKFHSSDPEYIKKRKFLEAVIISCKAAINYAKRYAKLAERSEEHTSELQSRQYLVCRLLLEKKYKSYRSL